MNRIRNEKAIASYSLVKRYETPTGEIAKGVTKTEEEWMCIFPNLNDGDCDIKRDWFEYSCIRMAYIDLSKKEYDLFVFFMESFCGNVEYLTTSSRDGEENEVKTILEVLLIFIDLLEKAKELK